MTELIYLTDSYKKTLTTTVASCEPKGQHWELVLTSTIFYPEGGGQPSDKGMVITPSGKAHVKNVRLAGDTVIHECTVEGVIQAGEEARCEIDWILRYQNMRIHTAGHIVHEAVKRIAPQLVALKGEHGAHPYIEYIGSVPIDKTFVIEKESNAIVSADVAVRTEFVTLEELMARASWVPAHLPKNKPLRILTIGDNDPIPDGGTQVNTTKETGAITITAIENADDHVRICYQVETGHAARTETAEPEAIPAPELTRMLMEVESSAKEIIASSDRSSDALRLELLGTKSNFAQVTKNIKYVPVAYRQEIGKVINFVKEHIEEALSERASVQGNTSAPAHTFIDVTMPGVRPTEGHLHIVTQAIMDITRIFERIGFTRVRHPEVDWDWYPFESLNMPPQHPARDEWETFFLEYPGKPTGTDKRKQKIVLTPHTSNGQVREMEKGVLPIRMINIAKCYRRQIDVSHTPMFHQFEGLYIDRNVSIGHLKGVFDYFVKQFFGADRITRLRPFHFQFTEPSFEVDINCGICLGSGKLPDGSSCKLCKAGWLELGGAGMVHPVVLRNGGVDPDVYSGFAFGWGIERTSMMKSGTNLDDIRLLYSNDVRFLEQF